jgi:hypothetical protein
MFGFSPKKIEAYVLSLAKYSPELLPPCIDSKQFDCDHCAIGDRNSCVVVLNEDFLSLLRWKVSHLSNLTEEDHADELLMNLVEVFESQGSALHLDKILSLMKKQNSNLNISVTHLRKMLKDNAEFFNETDPNVFVLKLDHTDSIEK